MKAILHLPDGTTYHIVPNETEFPSQTRDRIRDYLKAERFTAAYRKDDGKEGYIILAAELLKKSYITIE